MRYRLCTSLVMRTRRRRLCESGWFQQAAIGRRDIEPRPICADKEAASRIVAPPLLRGRWQDKDRFIGCLPYRGDALPRRRCC